MKKNTLTNRIILIVFLLCIFLLNTSNKYKNYVNESFTYYESQFEIIDSYNIVVQKIKKFRSLSLSLDCSVSYSTHKNMIVSYGKITEGQVLINIKSFLKKDTESCNQEYFKIISETITSVFGIKEIIHKKKVDKIKIKILYLLNNITMTIVFIFLFFRKDFVRFFKSF